MKAEITKIKLQLKDREIELTAQEARDVQKELNRLFDMEKSELQKLQDEWNKNKPATGPMPYPVPIYIERTPSWPAPWTVWCGTTCGSQDMTNVTLCMAVGRVA
jgi:hypothetical protein